MALSEFVALDTKTMVLKGFVDLGDHTPDNLKSQQAGHALVFMFQPFRGSWVQVY